MTIALLLFSSVFLVFPVNADGGIVASWGPLTSDNGHFKVSIYLYRDTDSDPNRDYYAVRVFVSTDPDVFTWLDLKISSVEGITDYWRPLQGSYGGGSIGFSYPHIGFSINIPKETVWTSGGMTDYIRWEKGFQYLFEILPNADESASGWHVPEDSTFSFTVELMLNKAIFPYFFLGRPFNLHLLT